MVYCICVYPGSAWFHGMDATMGEWVCVCVPCCGSVDTAVEKIHASCIAYFVTSVCAGLRRSSRRKEKAGTQASVHVFLFDAEFVLTLKAMATALNHRARVWAKPTAHYWLRYRMRATYNIDVKSWIMILLVIVTPSRQHHRRNQPHLTTLFFLRRRRNSEHCVRVRGGSPRNRLKHRRYMHA